MARGGGGDSHLTASKPEPPFYSSNLSIRTGGGRQATPGLREKREISLARRSYEGWKLLTETCGGKYGWGGGVLWVKAAHSDAPAGNGALGLSSKHQPHSYARCLGL